jgi:hypothetical protein
MFKERLKLETVSFHMHLYLLLINIEDELDQFCGLWIHFDHMHLVNHHHFVISH